MKHHMEKGITTNNISTKGIATRNVAMVASLLIIILAAFGYWSYRCLCPSQERVAEAKAVVKAFRHYEFRQNGKLIFRFDEDTTTLAACFMDQWTLVPSCRGNMAVAYNTKLNANPYQGIDEDSVFQERIDSIDSVYADSNWKVSELNYYVHSHSVQDAGYNMICDFTQRETIIRESARKLVDSLKHVSKKGHVQLVRSLSYRAFFRNLQGKWVNAPCQPIKQMDGENEHGIYLFQLASGKTPDGVTALSPRLASCLVRAHANTLRKKINYQLKPDSLGWYEGSYDSLYQASGHGKWQGFDGTYYEGGWKNGKRDGFGYSIAPKKPLRVGEWKNDRYKGERLVYTSERIYGIDISKYQHGKGKKKYSIDWGRLRITHLGSISRKTVSGTVNFPIRYIYIKSTEGKTMLNPYYKKDYRAARTHGFKVGTYHFFSTVSPAAEQANHFLKHSIIQKGDFPPVLDVEPLPSQIKKMGGPGVLFARVRTWLRLVERATGSKPILYISQTFVNRYLPMAPDLKRNYQVWIARYGEYKPDIHLVYWQLCPDGKVAGIMGEVDINVFNGYNDAFLKFSKNESIR